MVERSQTALGVARSRFVEGLPKKAREVRGSLALLAGTPSDPRSRDELRRRLHALYASAQVFRIVPLAEALKEAVEKIDEVRRRRQPFSQAALDELANLVATIPALGRDSAPSPMSLSEYPRAGPPTQAPSHPPKPAPERAPTVDTIVSVLVIDEPKWQARVRGALPPDRYEVVVASEAEEGLRLARSGAPDLVLADRAMILRGGVDFIGRLRNDPLTDFVPVVLLLPPGSPLDPIAVREAGADEALLKPFDAAKLLQMVQRVASNLGGARGASTLTGDLTVEEIADRIANEIRRGLVEAAAQGKDISVPIGDGTPLLAATWSAIGRVRAHLAERSGGRLRFRESPQRGGPSFVSVVGETAPIPDDELVDLAGRRVLVVDDDPAVVWFFAGLLREHGAHAIEAEDGVEGLAKARANHPDLVISDILMPRLDGFGLTRALKRDPMLADIPVILLSWKEDFLQRMRQLKAGASGYLRKEAGSAQILTAIRDALRPRAHLETRLDTGGEVRGRLEDTGVPVLLSTVAKRRPDARVTVRDPSSLYEVDLRGGEIVAVTRTALDGGFARGENVLVSLIGSTAGRYTVVDATGSVRNTFERPFDEAMEQAIAELAARVDSVSGKNLAKAARVVLDEDVLHGVMSSSPEELERVVAPLRTGRGPRDLLMGGVLEPRVLEEFLVDLARQGAIREVYGPDGEDRIALAREAREQGLHPDISEHDDKGTLSWLPTDETNPEITAVTAPPAEVSEPPPEPAQALAPEVRSDEVTLEFDVGDDRLEDAETPDLPIPAEEPEPPEPSPAAAPVNPDMDWDDERDEDDEPDGANQLEAADADDFEEDEFEEDEFEEDEFEEDEFDELDLDEVELALSVPPTPMLVQEEVEPIALTPPPRVDGAPPLEAPLDVAQKPTSEPEGMGLLGWSVVALILGAIGFVGLRLLLANPAPAETPAGPMPPTEPAAHSSPEPEPAPTTEPPSPTPEPVAAEPTPVDPSLPAPYGRETSGITDVGVSVADGQGLLVLEPLESGGPISVRVGDRALDLGAERTGIALDPGVHHLGFTHGERTEFVWVAVAAGRTRFAPAPF